MTLALKTVSTLGVRREQAEFKSKVANTSESAFKRSPDMLRFCLQSIIASNLWFSNTLA